MWNEVWRAPVQQRIRAFLWVLLHERLLCNTIRVKRRLSDDPTCIRCQHSDETLLHLFRDCPAARHIWQQVGGAAHYQTFFTGDLQQWIIRNLKAEGLVFAEKWPTCFAVTLWWCWRWRNHVVFNRSSEIPVDIGRFLHSRIIETWNALNKDNHSSASSACRKEEIYIRWKAPPLDWFALNSDGASKGSPGPAGGGGVIRNAQGDLISGFSANFGICSSFRAEVKAVARGLELARELGIQRLVVQMDNSACIQMLTNCEYGGGECFHLLNHCRKLINMADWAVRLEHCYREGNKVADLLANKGVIQEERLNIFNEAPQDVRQLILCDCMGVTAPRLIRIVN